MKALIISILCLGVLVAIWTAFDSYSDARLDGYIYEINKLVMPAVEREDWESARAAFDRVSDDWHKYRKISTFFFDRRLLNETDYSIARAKYYIKAEDLSNSSGELASLKEQLTFFHSNESFNLANIF